MPDSVAKRRWDAEHTAAITLKLNARTDADILSALEGKARQTEIKRLLRAALAAEKGDIHAESICSSHHPARQNHRR